MTADLRKNGETTTGRQTGIRETGTTGDPKSILPHNGARGTAIPPIHRGIRGTSNPLHTGPPPSVLHHGLTIGTGPLRHRQTTSECRIAFRRVRWLRLRVIALMLQHRP